MPCCIVLISDTECIIIQELALKSWQLRDVNQLKLNTALLVVIIIKTSLPTVHRLVRLSAVSLRGF